MFTARIQPNRNITVYTISAGNAPQAASRNNKKVLPNRGLNAGTGKARYLPVKSNNLIARFVTLSRTKGSLKLKEKNQKEPQQATGSAEKKAFKAAAKAAANISADSLQAATAAAKQAAAIHTGTAQAAAAAAKSIPFDDDLQSYINSILAATSYPDMTDAERTAYLQAVKTLNAQLKENVAELAQLANMELFNNAEMAAHLVNGTLLQVYSVLDNLLAFYQSNAFKNLSELFPDMKTAFEGTTIQQETILDTVLLLEFCHQLEAAEPFAAAETAAYKKKNGLESVTFRQFEKEILPRCLERAAAADAEQGKEKEPQPKTGQKTLTPKEIETLKSILPKKHVMPISKVANMLPVVVTDENNVQGFDVSVSNRGKINTRVIVTLNDDNGKISFSGRPYTEYDRSVMDAIISLWVYGDESHNITPNMVYRAMTNKRQTEYVSPQAVGAVTKSIEKMRHIFVRIDATDECIKRGITDENGNPVDEMIIDGYLLAVEGIKLTAGGKKFPGYHIIGEPILYKYSKMDEEHPQCITIKSSLLDIKEVKGNKLTTVSLKNSDRLIVIRDYLIRRIKVMKRDRDSKKPSQSNRILFDDLYQKTGIDAGNKKQKQNARNHAIDALNFFKAEGSLFKDYKIIKEGNAIRAIDIIF